MIQEFKIPRNRVVKVEKVKRQLLKNVTMTMSKDGDVFLEGEPEPLLLVENVIKAIGRGFPPTTALLLLDENYQLVIIPVRGTQNTIKRLLARVIGRDGRAKKMIETRTQAKLCIFGKTVSLIGDDDAITRATTAVEDLLSGRKHAFVYNKLEKMKRFA